MVSRPFSFRLPDASVQALEALRLEDETLNQTAQRVLMGSLKLSTPLSAKTSLDVDIKELVKLEVATSLADVRSQLEELRGKSLAR